MFFFPRPRRGRAPAAARSLPAGRASGSSLRSRASPRRWRVRTGGGDSSGTVPPERLALHFFPALRAPRDRHPVPPSKSPRVPRSLPCARPPAPARSRSPAGTDCPIKNWKLKKEQEPGGSRLPGPGGAPISDRSKRKKRRKERLPAGRNFYFLLLEKELRINFLWPTRRRSFGATRTLAGRR